MDLLSRDVTFATLAQGQSGAAKRSRLIAQNIANVNTPGYARRDVEFAEVLADALDKSGTRRQRVDEVLDITAREVVEDRLFFRADRGGVDIDREMAELAKNSLYSGAMSSLLMSKIRMYKQVIRGGRS